MRSILQVSLFSMLSLIAVGGTAQALETGCAVARRALCGVGVSAGELVQLSGQVQVSRGAGFVRAAAGARLGPGDRVVVGEGGGVLALGPKCSLPLQRFSVLQLAASGENMCVTSLSRPLGAPMGDAGAAPASGSVTTSAAGSGSGAVLGLGSVTASGAVGAGAAGVTPLATVGAYVAGATLIGGGVAAALAASNNKTISP